MGFLNKLVMKLQKDEIEYNKKFRDRFIPEKYNQIELVDYLENEELDHYISISNRADGKTFNYLHYFLDYSLRTGVGFTLIARHYTVRFSYQKVIQEIIDTLIEDYDPRKFHFVRTDFYILVGYADKELGIITDLNQATDLKYLSNYLKHFPIMIYDEFLALEGDYLPDEWDRLKTIYSSINRNENIKNIKHPKIFYLGNAVNFSSPVLAHLNIFEYLENHKINTVQSYNNVVIEMRRNEEVNEDRNLRAFSEEKDNMTMGQFSINKHNIADSDYKKIINQNRMKLVIKGYDNFISVEYNRSTMDILLSITTYEEDYHFNIEIKDNKEDSIFLDESYYSEDHIKKYNNDLFKFNNQYSKDTILSTYSTYSMIRLYKVIGVYEMEFFKDESEKKEKQYKDNYIEQSKQAIFRKFYGI